MREGEIGDLKARITEKSDGELVRMVTTEAADYRVEALGFAKSELMRRGVSVRDVPGGASEPDRNLADLPCAACGGEMRSGWLFAKREMTIVFPESNEERFVEALACRRCGRVRLLADFETEVDEGLSVRYL